VSFVHLSSFKPMMRCAARAKKAGVVDNSHSGAEWTLNACADSALSAAIRQPYAWPARTVAAVASTSP
jgi:hypothetical protein